MELGIVSPMEKNFGYLLCPYSNRYLQNTSFFHIKYKFHLISHPYLFYYLVKS